MSQSRPGGLFFAFVCLVFASLFVPGGCIVRIDDGGGGNGGGNDNGNGVPTTVTIVVTNDTGTSLDPEIFVTGAAITDPNQLFAPGNKYTRLGAGRRGVMAPGSQESFDLECGTTRTIGTQGGSFGEDLDNPEGRGQQRIISQDVFFSCGDTIEFRYSQSGGAFVTSVSVTR